MVLAVVTGGGTSGHVVPALAILEALIDDGQPPSELKYVGARRGIETTLLGESPFESVFLPISGLQRSLTPRSLIDNVALSWRVPRSIFIAWRLLRQWRPKVVVSVGGYASEPMAMAARLCGVPIVCVSYDRVPGLATRRQAKHAVASAVAFADTSLPRSVLTGAPVRGELRRLDRARCRSGARSRLGVAEDALCVVVLGGSLGSRALNGFATRLVDACSDIDGLAIIHVCGSRFLDDAPPTVPSTMSYLRLGYTDRVADLYCASDLVVTRAGASTVAEIATVGVASVMVPWSGAAHDHQRLNASWLVDNGAAVALDETDLVEPAGLERVRALLLDDDARSAMADNARELGSVHRGTALVDLIRNATS